MTFQQFCQKIMKNGPYAKADGIVLSEDEKLKESFKRKAGFIGIAGLIGGIGVGYYFSCPNPTIIALFFSNLARMEWKKFFILWGLTIFVSGMAVLLSLNEYYKEKGSRRGREHGSSKLMSEADMPKFRQDFFFDPKIVVECKGYKKEGENTYFDPIELKRKMRQTTACENERIKNPIMPFTKLEDAKEQVNSPNYRCFMASQILAQDVYVSMNCKYINRNLNTITIGGSGQGKSFSELFPNVMMANSNYVITDPSGEILQKCGNYLMTQGYSIKVFNIKDFDMSMRYNPLAYIKNESDINVVVDALNKNIDGDKPSGGGSNDFFEKAQRSLTAALFSALRELYPNEPEKQTLFNVMQLLRMAEQKTDPETGEQYSELDDIFNELKMKNSRSYAVKMYENFKVGGPKTCGSVIISATAVFGRFFDNDSMARLVEADDLNLYDFATGVDENGNPLKCALFLVIPQDTSTYNFLVSMIYSQLFSIVTQGGEKWRLQHNLENPALARHLSFWLDEFANVGKIPNFLEVLSVVRKYNISINIIIQALSQLKGLYKDDWETIIGNCDSMIYLGGQEASTIKMLSEKLGKETIKTHSNTQQTKGGSISHQSSGRELMTTSEIEQISRAFELVFITGCKPFKARKYDLTKHPNYNFFGEADPKNNLNITEFNYLLPDDAKETQFREIPMWYATGKTDQYGVEIMKLEARREKLLSEEDRIIRIEDNTIDKDDIIEAVKNIEDKVYNITKKIRTAEEEWQKAREKKSMLDKAVSDTQTAVKAKKKTPEQLEKVQKAFQEAADMEKTRHLQYLGYKKSDFEKKIERAESDSDKAKYKNELNIVKKEIDEIKTTIGQAAEQQTIARKDLRELALSPNEVKAHMDAARVKALSQKIASNDAREQLKNCKEQQDIEQISLTGVITEIDGYNPLSMYKPAEGNMFAP